MDYVSRYNLEHYRRIWIRRSTYDKLASMCDRPIVDCVDEIVDAVSLPSRLFEELKKYVLRRYSGTKHLRYAGGDWFIKDVLLDVAVRVPPKRATFVEVFGGSGVMSQLVPRSKFPNVVYNDIDRDLVALHEMVKSNPDLLASVLLLLPYSRYLSEYVSKSLGGRELGGLVGASVLFYMLTSSHSGLVGSGFSTTREGRSRAGEYASNVAAIYKAAERFRDVTIECLDFRDVIEKYDSENTLFYLDPPYLSVGDRDRSDYYRHGFNPGDAARLASTLKRIRGYFMLKIHEDNEVFYRSVPFVDRVEVTTKKFMEVIRDESRGEFKYLVLTNYRVGGLSAAGSSPK